VLCWSAFPLVPALGSTASAAGVPQDYAQAVGWFHKAAEQGEAEAQSSLGFMYDNGLGVRQDDAEALAWYRKAAKQGDTEGQFNLAQMYHEGQGVPQDYAQAVEWFLKAAEQGTPKAQLNLGVMYGLGQGVPRDYVQAHMWINLASASKQLDAVDHGKAVQARDAAAANMTPAQIAEAQRLASEWKPK
jgi:uncharacterized protein